MGNSGRDSWDIWLDLHIGDSRLGVGCHETSDIPQKAFPAQGQNAGARDGGPASCVHEVAGLITTRFVLPSMKAPWRWLASTALPFPSPQPVG